MKHMPVVVREIARIAGTLVFVGCAIFIYGVIDYSVHPHESPLPAEVKITIYPAILLMMGALIAWKWPAVGGLLLLGGIGLLVVLKGWPISDRNPRDLREWMIVIYLFLLPATGLLHLFSARLNRLSNRNARN